MSGWCPDTPPSPLIWNFFPPESQLMKVVFSQFQFTLETPGHVSYIPRQSRLSERLYTQTKPGRREHSKQRDGARSIPTVIAKTQSPYQNKGEQIVPLYPESFVPNSGIWLSQSPVADRAPSPSHASALVLYLLSWKCILRHRFSGQIEKGEKTNHSLDLLPLFPQLSTLLADFTPA